MTSELFINVQPQEVSIAITEDKLLMEFHKEEQNVSFTVGNIYLGRVKKIMPGLNACFVDVGSGKEAFLQKGSFPLPKIFTTPAKQRRHRRG